ncbi:L-ornithine N(5)-monooxygenase PvdA [Sphaerisporangium flaviroseum]|uniref:L-lysine N6-monooxygenase MbtG n=1 Tax=Sphaerisporangium flaviroseum TaxID=509199 RepID=A0ABP7HBI3_9ACTN
MKHRDVELLAIGAGPANLALAVALEELAPDGLADDSLVIEQADTVAWQPGMLLPEAQSQVSFLKDLVTLRNPCSRFSFVNYLHSVGRLSQFINMGSLWPYRIEISDYFKWVADSLTRVRLEYARRCTAVEPLRDADGTLTGWLTRLADGSTIRSRYLVMGIGRDAHIPEEFASLPARRVVHSTRYIQRIAELPKAVPYRVVVIGGAQSAAEMFDAVQSDLPGCQPTMVMRSIGLKTYENSKFTNELYFPTAVDGFFGARPEAREQILQEMHITNYSGLNPATLEKLYSALYLDRLTGKGRLRVVTMHDVTSAREDSDEVVLELTDRRTGEVEELRCDLVLLGSGFVRAMPSLVRGLANALGLEDVTVNRTYQLDVPGAATARCYLQGVNEATHGIADSLLSMQAVRAWEITNDILAGRADGRPEGLGEALATGEPAEGAPVPAAPVPVSAN